MADYIAEDFVVEEEKNNTSTNVLAQYAVKLHDNKENKEEKENA